MLLNLNEDIPSSLPFSLPSKPPENNQNSPPDLQLNQNVPILNLEETPEEILNISKIKEGFYIGDKISAINLEVITEFKITHIINCTGNQIINQWESIGIKYLTLDWNISPSQILFDSKDEIVEKIISFIEISFKEGEGLLAHSYKGQNRACIIALIYLMKKYKWSLTKSMQYLKSKKSDVNISTNFYFQLEKFQQRLKERGELSRDIPWEFENLIDEEEKLMRNTYMNGLSPSKLVDKNHQKLILDLFNGKANKKNNKRHINWIDKNPINSSSLEIENLTEDLILKKDIQPIDCHQRLKPKKSCIIKVEINQKKDNFSLSHHIKNNYRHNTNRNVNIINIINNKINNKNSYIEKLKLNIINNSSISRNNSCNKNSRSTPKKDNKNKHISFKKYKNIINTGFNRPKITQNIKTTTQKKANLSSSNTNPNTPITNTKDLCTEENNSNNNNNKNNIYSRNIINTDNSSEKDKLLFSMISLNSLNPLNIKNYGAIEKNNRNNKFFSASNITNISVNLNNNYNNQLNCLTSQNSIYATSTYSRASEGNYINNSLKRSTKKHKRNIINDSSLSNFHQNSMNKKQKLNLIISNNNIHPLFFKNKNTGPIIINNNFKTQKKNIPDFNYLNINNTSNIQKGHYTCQNLNSPTNFSNISFYSAINRSDNKNDGKNYSNIIKRPLISPQKNKENDNKNVKSESKNKKTETKIIRKIYRPNTHKGKGQSGNLTDKKNDIRRNFNSYSCKTFISKGNKVDKNLRNYSQSNTSPTAKNKNNRLW